MQVRYLAWLSGVLLTAGAAVAETPANYVGAGVRTGLGDPTSAVINAKVRLTTFDNASLSIRPEVFLGDITEVRLPLTLETEIVTGLSPYIGGGIAINTDGLNQIDPMVTGGLDTSLANNLVLKLEVNLVFQTNINDTDTEFVSTLNYAF